MSTPAVAELRDSHARAPRGALPSARGQGDRRWFRPEARDALDEARQLSPADPASKSCRLAARRVESVTLASPPLESVGESSVDSVDADDLRPLGPPQSTIPQASQPGTLSAGGDVHFRGHTGLDTLRTPSSKAGAVAVAPSPRQRTRSAGVLAIGLTLVTLAGWQAWTHKEQWTAVFRTHKLASTRTRVWLPARHHLNRFRPPLSRIEARGSRHACTGSIRSDAQSQAMPHRRGAKCPMRSGHQHLRR
jgi:hypothetical protein